MTRSKATDAYVFEASLDKVMLRRVRPGDRSCDSVRAHKPEHQRALVEATCARPLVLSPYSPDLGPEHAWSSLTGP